jgi:hypothetical protein
MGGGGLRRPVSGEPRSTIATNAWIIAIAKVAECSKDEVLAILFPLLDTFAGYDSADCLHLDAHFPLRSQAWITITVSSFSFASWLC